MSDPNNDMFLQLIQQQLRNSQQGNIENDVLLKSLKGGAGAFSPPMPLGDNNSIMPKTNIPIDNNVTAMPKTVGQSPMDQFMNMQPPRGQIDPFTRQQDQQNPNMSQQTANAPNNMIQMILRSLMGR